MGEKRTLPPGIYGITAEKFSLGRTNIEVVREMIAGGVRVIQYREKRHTKKYCDILTECRAIRQLTRDAGVLFIVNDHVDIALLTEADGVHVGQDDLPVAEARSLLGTKMMIGVSTHSPDQAQRAVADGADYIGVGPIFATATKEDVCAPVGLPYLEYVTSHLDIPFVAIGGIKRANIDQVIARDARTVCLVTEIVGAPDIGERIAELQRIIAGARGESANFMNDHSRVCEHNKG